MKKIYQNPALKIVNVHTARMIATSLGIQGNAQGTTMLSRKSDTFWDDDEEE